MSLSGLTSSLRLLAPGYAAVAIWGGAAVLIVLLVRAIWSWYRLRHIPGPFVNSITSLWMLKKTVSGTLHYNLVELSDKYG